MSRPIVVLSPHRDDAIFSLAHALRFWASQSIPLRVLNVFTISNYAPHAPKVGVDSAGPVSQLRRREDRVALRAISPEIEHIDLDLLDAPLQFRVEARSVSGPQAISPSSEHIRNLSNRVRPELRNALVISPLALGNHVNHVMVKHAAMLCVPSKRLAFYEDLPYATWAMPEEWKQRLSEISVRHRAWVVRSRGHACWKQRMASHYGTQISRGDAARIADWGRSYGSGERLWLPNNSIHWQRVFAIKRSPV